LRSSAVIRSRTSAFILAAGNGRQCLLAQNIGIAFACLGNLNDLHGDGLSDTIVTIASPQSNAGHFEGDAKNPRSLLVESLTIKKWAWGAQPPTPEARPLSVMVELYS
jgi:hypothetical protein